METIKNFFAICFATITFLLGIALPVLLIFVINQGFDFLSLVIFFITLILFAVCLMVAKYNQRVKLALEYPFLFLP